MSVPEPVPEIVALYRTSVLQLQYESTAIEPIPLPIQLVYASPWPRPN
jgi:hypothetical protein